MYLLPAGSSARSAIKGLGAFRLRRHRLACCGLGQDVIYLSTNPNAVPPPSGPSDVPAPNLPPLTVEQYNSIFGTGPIPPPQPAGPAPPAYSNVLTTAQTSQDPTNYISPQAAIAAGLDPTKVYAAWSAALAKYPTQQAALAAGVPAGVVTSLWAASRSATPATTASFLDQAPLGIANKYIIAGAAGLFLLVSLAKRR